MSDKLYKYTFTQETNYSHSDEDCTDVKVTMEVNTNAQRWTVADTYFKQFLEGCGFAIPADEKKDEYDNIP